MADKITLSRSEFTVPVKNIPVTVVLYSSSVIFVVN